VEQVSQVCLTSSNRFNQLTSYVTKKRYKAVGFINECLNIYLATEEFDFLTTELKASFKIILGSLMYPKDFAPFITDEKKVRLEHSRRALTNFTFTNFKQILMEPGFVAAYREFLENHLMNEVRSRPGFQSKTDDFNTARNFIIERFLSD